MYRPRKTIDDWIKDFGEMSESDILEFPPGFEPPIYNVWKKQTKTNAERFSNVESTIHLPSSSEVLALPEHSLKLSA